jgi:hypothetical protein
MKRQKRHHVPAPHDNIQPVRLEDLPPDAQDLIGTACDCSKCDDQPLCPPNPNITCQVVSVDQGMRPAFIANARKGDLVLCPGDGAGVIGALLSALNPAQVYSHMGIMVADQLSVRHSTAIPERMMADPEGRLFGLADVPVPLDGFVEEKVQFGWPGTITQSVDEAYHASQDSDYPDAKYSDRTNPDKDHLWSVNALGFDPVYSIDGQRRPALVVSCCSNYESQYPVLRTILRMVADEVLAMRGHYRFYAYTDGSIALDPAFNGPPMPLFDSKGNHRENVVPHPTDPCATVPTDHTVPVVCSSLIWTAVRRIRGEDTFIILDNDVHGDPASSCLQVITAPPNQMGDAPDPQNRTADGLYYYSVGQRKAAVQALYDRLYEQVQTTIMEEIDKLFDALDKVLHVQVPRVAWAALIAAVTSGAGAGGAVAALLGISVLTAADVIQFLTEMPSDIANQICNSFANDGVGGVKSTAWMEPGEGRAVGPDNILWFWDPTQQVLPPLFTPITRVIGLYGQNTELVLRPRMPGPVPKCEWQLSPGPACLFGRVMLANVPNNPSLIGTSVNCACRSTMTNADGVYTIEVPAGRYWATAGWQDPFTGIWWSDEVLVDVPFATHTEQNFYLKPPPSYFRQVEIRGHMDTVDRQIVGKDIWMHPNLNATARMGPYADPSIPGDTTGTVWEKSFNPKISDEGSVNLYIHLSWLPGGVISGYLTVQLKDGDDVDDTAAYNFTLNHGDIQVVPPIDLDSGELAPDHAHIELTIENRQQL